MGVGKLILHFPSIATSEKSKPQKNTPTSLVKGEQASYVEKEGKQRKYIIMQDIIFA